MLRNRSLITTILFACFLFANIGIATAGMEEDILALINKHRAKKGLSQLTDNRQIANAADKHSKDMASRRVGFGHSGFDGRMDKIMKGMTGATGCAENVAYGAETAEEVVKMWLKSPGHKKNIEGNYNYSGIGIAKDKNGTLYFTQIFIKAKGD